MSWASRRRFTYASGVIAFFAIVLGGPLAYWYFSIPATCFDGKRNQGETTVDRGGPCEALDERQLSPSAVLWARSFRVRDGSYTAAAYIQNPNRNAGIEQIEYLFRFYDSRNILIGERGGSTYVMPGGITPVIESAINTGERIVTHTYFEFKSAPDWGRMTNPAAEITINDKTLQTPESSPRIIAQVRNTSVDTLRDIQFATVVFDPAGNAFAASKTLLPRLEPNATGDIVFTWPDPFNISVGRIEIIPMLPPRGPSM